MDISTAFCQILRLDPLGNPLETYYFKLVEFLEICDKMIKLGVADKLLEVKMPKVNKRVVQLGDG